MKNAFHPLVFLLFFIASITSCKILPPTYKGISNPKLERVGVTGLKFGADVTFYNPNRLRCKITDIALDVKMNEKQVATIGEKSDITVKKRSDFVIPIGVTLKLSGGILDNISLLSDLVKSQDASLSLEGNVKVKVLGMTFPIPVKYRQPVNLGKL